MKLMRGIRTGFHKLPIVFAAASVALGASVAIAGPAGATDWNPRSWTVQVGSESWDQEIQGMAFLPTDIVVNEGDTINWQANSAEIHTVTFLARDQSLESLQPFNPGNPAELFHQGGAGYDGRSYYNSGLLANVSVPGFPVVKSYSLTFPHQGDFTYYCLVHGRVMKGTVHVQGQGSAYPHTQADYNRSSTAQKRSILRDGRQLDASLTRQAGNHLVLAGGDDGIAMVMRFLRPTVTVHVGETVVFTNTGMGAPHTVTFGTEPANVFAPSGDPAHFGGGNLNSGIMPPAPAPGSTFSVTFTATGTFKYICALHDYMGMAGQVNVVD